MRRRDSALGGVLLPRHDRLRGKCPGHTLRRSLLNSASKGWYSGVLPKYLTGEWYGYVASEHDIPHLLFITFLVAIVVVAISIVIAFPAAYALAGATSRARGRSSPSFCCP